MNMDGNGVAMKELRELTLMLHACADATRLRIVRLLADGQEISVSDLTLLLRLSQPLVSWHLRILRRSGLISTRRIGRQALYRLNRPGWDSLRAGLDQILLPPAAGWAADGAPLLPALRQQETTVG
jgi:ArsR family transcriptional regulator, arsenate/arsenite/antimonite-responsive transcriptional repressor